MRPSDDVVVKTQRNACGQITFRSVKGDTTYDAVQRYLLPEYLRVVDAIAGHVPGHPVWMPKAEAL